MLGQQHLDVMEQYALQGRSVLGQSLIPQLTNPYAHGSCDDLSSEIVLTLRTRLCVQMGYMHKYRINIEKEHAQANSYWPAMYARGRSLEEEEHPQVEQMLSSRAYGIRRLATENKSFQ